MKSRSENSSNKKSKPPKYTLSPTFEQASLKSFSPVSAFTKAPAAVHVVPEHFQTYQSDNVEIAREIHERQSSV